MKLGICGWGERFLAVFFFWGGGSGVFFLFCGVGGRYEANNTRMVG